MSHNITNQDGVFSVRDPGWHGLATVFADYPTREEAQRLVHPWEPETRPVYREAFPSTPEYAAGYQAVDGWKEVYRNDTGAGLGIVTESYQPVLNNDMWDIAEAIENGDRASVRYETGGSLKGGAKVWLLLRLAEPLVVKGDPNGATVPYYALQDAKDGSGAFRGQATMTRIICDNTAQAADLDARIRGTEFVFRHTKNVASRIEEAQIALRAWRTSIEEWAQFNEHLIALRVTPEQRTGFIEAFLPEPPFGFTSERVRANVAKARGELKFILDGSPTTDQIGLTAYGLVQGAVEYHQHYRKAASRESAFKRAYLDRSQATRFAVSLALEAVGA